MGFSLIFTLLLRLTELRSVTLVDAITCEGPIRA
jgi:hypothetical protein